MFINTGLKKIIFGVGNHSVFGSQVMHFELIKHINCLTDSLVSQYFIQIHHVCGEN